MKSTIRLFKAVPIKTKKKRKLNQEILARTIKSGFVFSEEVIGNYSGNELVKLIRLVEREIGLKAKEINSSFHKSWKKIKEASLEQLVIEQIIHYFTTYGMESLGLYDKDCVYIPNEVLEISEIDIDKIELTIIKGYTKKELKEKLFNLLQTGIALKEDTIKDVLDIALYVELNEKEIRLIKNKEVKTALYEYLGLIPENPVEFLRYIIYRSTDKTLLIKNLETIEEIKSKRNLGIVKLFIKYKEDYGLERLAEIFYRFKPLFLAFRTNRQLKTIINKIRKLAVKYHKPMEEDYLNEITAKIKKGERINKKKLQDELSEVNIFRKIRLAYALKFRTKDVSSILYKIRNGKGYATKFNFDNKGVAKDILDIVVDSVVKDISRQVKGKKIYIPENITYALPATEKQFTGNIPSGTCITIPKDMVFGVHWKNVKRNRIDLDFSLVGVGTKYGWDANYRDEDRSILFSGDVTDAPEPNGASELFYIKRQISKSFIVFVNYYNYDSDVEAPFKLFVAKEQVRNMRKNYMVNPNNLMIASQLNINQKQKVIGLVTITTNACRFYFSEIYLGRSITSSGSEFAENSRKYLTSFYKNTITLNEILEKAGAKIVIDEKRCDINLSPELLEKDSIIKLLKK